jgi:hypothetical protein
MSSQTSPHLSSNNECSSSPNVWYANPNLDMMDTILWFDRKLKPQGYPKVAEVTPHQKLIKVFNADVS